jgi:hypothetical protein
MDSIADTPLTAATNASATGGAAAAAAPDVDAIRLTEDPVTEADRVTRLAAA